MDLVDVRSFRELPESIGCVDCVDNGAEWVEIRFLDGAVKKVSFGFFMPPDSIKPLAERLADYRTENIGVIKKQFPNEKFEDRAQSQKEIRRRTEEQNSK